MKLTPDQVNKIKELTELGYMDSEIVKQFGNITDGAIYYWRKKLGIKSKFSYEKNSKIDHSKLVELFNAGLSDYKIAKELNVKPCSIFSYRKYHNIGRDRNLKYNKSNPISQFQLEVLIGTLFGDGSMRRINTNAYFSCMHGIKQKEYCEHKYQILKSLEAKLFIHKRKTIDKRTGVYYEDCTVKLPCNPDLNYLFDNFYPNGKKVMPKNVLKDYSEVSLAFHYMDDGCKSKNGYVLATQSFSKEDNLFFIDFLKSKFNLEATLWKRNVIYITNESKSLFRSLIEPFFL